MPVQGPKLAIGALVQQFLNLLSTVEGLDANIVNFVRSFGTNPRLAGDRDVLLRVTGPRPIPGLMEAAAEVTPAVVRGFVVQLRSRLGIDVSDRNDQWLLWEPTEDEPGVFGHSVLEDRIITAVLPWRPVDDDDNMLPIQPVLLDSGGEFQNDLRQLPPDDPTWGSSLLVFAVSYLVSSQELPEVED